MRARLVTFALLLALTACTASAADCGKIEAGYKNENDFQFPLNAILTADLVVKTSVMSLRPDDLDKAEFDAPIGCFLKGCHPGGRLRVRVPHLSSRCVKMENVKAFVGDRQSYVLLLMRANNSFELADGGVLPANQLTERLQSAGCVALNHFNSSRRCERVECNPKDDLPIDQWVVTFNLTVAKGWGPKKACVPTSAARQPTTRTTSTSTTTATATTTKSVGVRGTTSKGKSSAPQLMSDGLPAVGQSDPRSLDKNPNSGRRPLASGASSAAAVAALLARRLA